MANRKTMTSTLNLNSRIGLFITICSISLGLLAAPSVTKAQSNALSLSVSPTLYEMSADPGQVWQSSLRIINPNPYPITVYGNTVNFKPRGESGLPNFIPLVDEVLATSTLASWIQLAEPEVTIPAEQTVELPFSINVPEGAAPGGHFAAIFVGTKPPADRPDRPQLETAQIVSSLIFLRVSGDVIEDAAIRSFRTTSAIVNKPEATFELRFENSGNVHVQPQGEIEIFNMWGQERGVVPVNRDTLFGNVLPESVRKFTFTWSGAWSIADIGRYRAVATLAYGANARNFTSSEAAFWVIPWKPLLLIIGIAGLFIYLVSIFLRWYINRMLQLAGVQHDAAVNSVPQTTQKPSVVAPLERGMLDLRSDFTERSRTSGVLRGAFAVAVTRRRSVLIGAVLIACVVFFVWFIAQALTDDRAYEIEIQNSAGSVSVNSEEIAYQERTRSTVGERPSETTATSGPRIAIVNRSGESGLAAEARMLLEAAGIPIAQLKADLAGTQNNTVVVYDPDLQDQALEISQLLGGALLSAYTNDAETTEDITIYIGADYLSAVE